MGSAWTAKKKTTMNPLSIIIPSKSDANLGACVRAIRAAGETATVIVVEDFDGPTRFLLPCDEPVDWQMGEEARSSSRATSTSGIQMRGCGRRGVAQRRRNAQDAARLHRHAAGGCSPSRVRPHRSHLQHRRQPEAVAAGQPRRARRAPDGLLRMRLHPAAARWTRWACSMNGSSGTAATTMTIAPAGPKGGLENRDLLTAASSTTFNSQEHIPGTSPGRELPAQPEGVRREVGSVGGRASWEILISA